MLTRVLLSRLTTVMSLLMLTSALLFAKGGEAKRVRVGPQGVESLPVGLVSAPDDVLIEAVRLSAQGVAETTAPLIAGVRYRIVARGIVGVGVCRVLGCPAGSVEERDADAAFVSADSWKTAHPAATDARAGGIAIDDVLVDWGAFSSEHLYSLEIDGDGAPITLSYLDADGGVDDNTGWLEVLVFRSGGQPEVVLEWPPIPGVLSADAPSWVEPRNLSAAASIVTVAAGTGMLPAWPAWIEDPVAGEEDLEIIDAGRLPPGVVFDPRDGTIGRQTDWGTYIGGAFVLPELEPFNGIGVDMVGTPLSGIGGAVGLDADAAPLLVPTLERLGLSVEAYLDPAGGYISRDLLVGTLSETAAQQWPTIVMLGSEDQVRFAVMSGLEVFPERMDLEVFDPELPPSVGGLARYRVVLAEDETVVPVDSVPVIDGVLGLWAVSSPRGLNVSLTEFILDDGTRWFELAGHDFNWGRSFDLGMGAPGQDAGGEAFGFTWAMTDGDRAAGSSDEAVWRLIAPEDGEYAVWSYCAPEIDPRLLVESVSYHLTRDPWAPIGQDTLVGVVHAYASSARGWRLIGIAELLEDEEAFLRVPLEGRAGRRMVFDALLLVRLTESSPPARP